MTEPCDLDAVEARRLIGAKRLSPVELLESCIDRIEAVNPAVNAVVTKDYDGARKAAKAAEKAVMRGDGLGVLHGLPMGVKDLTNTAGLRTTYGSPLYKDFVPEEDERLVAVLRQAGANVLCKTNTPEFGAGANTTNAVFGPTGNPFDPKLICGGSSGGSAVALATNMMPIATGNDSGGSLRIPAAICGIVAHRGTPGLVPTERRQVGYTNFAVAGPMARTVDDMALMLSAMVGYDDRDQLSWPLDPADYRKIDAVDLSTIRVAVSEDLGFAPVDDRFRSTFRERVGLFKSAFKECVERDPDLGEVERCNWILRGQLFIARHRDRYNNARDKLGPNVVSNYEAALKMSVDEVAWAAEEQTRIFRSLQGFFADVDILICPTVGVPPFPVEQLYCDVINGKKLDNYIQWVALTWGLTIPGNPVTAIPCGTAPDGTPFGLQIVGKHHQDRFVIGVAKALEQLFRGNPKLARPIPDLGKLRS